jgi:membrane protein DedA with SNARE-associated domain
MPPPIFQYNLLHDSDVATSLMPEIHHQFRAPDRRAPNVVAFAVTGAVVVIFALYALSVLAMSGGNLAKVLTSPSSLLFAVNLAALLGLFLWYWLGKLANGPSMNELWVFASPVALTLAFTARNAVGSALRRDSRSLKSE